MNPLFLTEYLTEKNLYFLSITEICNFHSKAPNLVHLERRHGNGPTHTNAEVNEQAQLETPL